VKSTDQIRKLYLQYQEAERNGDAKTIASFYTEDALLIPPEQKPIKGRAEIYKYFEGVINSAIGMEISHIKAEGNIAWVTGLFYWDTDDQRRYLAFLDVWRQENEEWRLAACMWNSSDGFTMV
jgi:uncharacterized protein (TIGR02246 family)